MPHLLYAVEQHPARSSSHHLRIPPEGQGGPTLVSRQYQHPLIKSHLSDPETSKQKQGKDREMDTVASAALQAALYPLFHSMHKEMLAGSEWRDRQRRTAGSRERMVLRLMTQL
eukprot:1160379-Pelagomonas_calceolata.AAC.9